MCMREEKGYEQPVDKYLNTGQISIADVPSHFGNFPFLYISLYFQTSLLVSIYLTPTQKE